MERVSENPAPGSSPRQGQTTQSRIPLAHKAQKLHTHLSCSPNSHFGLTKRSAIKLTSLFGKIIYDLTGFRF